MLVMEDNDDLREDLVLGVRRRLPFVRVEESDRVEVGLSLIRRAAHRAMPFDVAILDFKLNSDVLTRNQRVDEHLCREIRRLMNDCLVLHVTGNSGDAEVMAHEARCHSGIREPRSRIIPKKDDYVDRTISEAALWIYTKPVHEILDALFLLPRMHAGIGRNGNRTGISASHLLARLEHWLGLHWSSLDEPTQSRVLGHFDRDRGRFFLRQNLADGASG